MLTTTLLLVFIGLSVVYSVSLKSGVQNTSLVWDQSLYAAIGVGVFFLLTFLDYRIFRDAAWVFYILVLVLLALVFFVGSSMLGATRWLDLGVFALQPSELAKVALIFVLARYFSRAPVGAHPFKTFLTSAIIMGVPTLMILAQPDLGSAGVMVIIWLAMLFLVNMRKLLFGLMGGVALALSPVVWFLLKPYQKERVLNFMQPEKDLLGSGYHIVQSKIAIGSGQLFGRGLGHGSQSQLNFLPVAHADFIFAVIGESLGFAGSLLVLGLFMVFIWRGIKAAMVAKDNFGMLLAAGIITMLSFQIFVNIGVTLGLVPATGIPLPLLSAGGTSIIVVLACIGMLESIAIRQRRAAFN